LAQDTTVMVSPIENEPRQILFHFYPSIILANKKLKLQEAFWVMTKQKFM